jgi:hypothetical protein
MRKVKRKFAAMKAQAFLEVRQRRRAPVLCPSLRRQADNRQPEQQEAGADQHVGRGDAQRREHQTARRWRDDAHALPDHRVEADSVHQVLAVDQSGENGLARRVAERLHTAGGKRQGDDVPHRDEVGCHQKRDDGDGARGHDLGREDDSALVDAVGDDAPGQV